jgi:hypothetical protein
MPTIAVGIPQLYENAKLLVCCADSLFGLDVRRWCVVLSSLQVPSALFYTKVCFIYLSAALHVCTLLRGADRISQLALCLLGHRLYVAKRTPRGTGMGCNDLTSTVLQMCKYQTRQLQILACPCWAARP